MGPYFNPYDLEDVGRAREWLADNARGVYRPYPFTHPPKTPGPKGPPTKGILAPRRAKESEEENVISNPA